MRNTKLKLTALSDAIMKDKEMSAILGGNCCTCSCYWENNTGSSSVDNRDANFNWGINSPIGCNQYIYCEDGSYYEQAWGYKSGFEVHE